MHAYVSLDIWQLLAGSIQEGGIYEICNFQTKPSTGSLRPITSHIIVRFVKHTTVQPVLADDQSIPLYKFEFVHLDELNGYVHRNFTDGLPTTTIGMSFCVCVAKLIIILRGLLSRFVNYVHLQMLLESCSIIMILELYIHTKGT